MNIREKQRLDLILGTLFLALLRLPVILLGRLLRREHSPQPKGDILFIKMAGGGSLVIAYPALLGIRMRYRERRLVLFTMTGLKPFAESFNIFDEIICVNDKDYISLTLSAFIAWRRCFGKVDYILDLEVYSKLTAVFGVLMAARNRVGFYLESTYWRKNIYTHLLFFNRFAGSHFFYEDMSKLLDAIPVSRQVCEEHFRKKLLLVKDRGIAQRIAIGHACSDFGTERMLTPEQWLDVFRRKGVTDKEWIFLGSKIDHETADRIIEHLKVHFPNASFKNECGGLSLMESISRIDSSDEFWGIDSALLHYARLLGKKTVSFWGPTDPNTRLKNEPELVSEIYYEKVPCSPCIHVAESPPCSGRNICIEALFNKSIPAVEAVGLSHF